MDALRVRWIWVAVIAALLVRLPAITTLPIDWDEPIYMEAAQSINLALHQGDSESIFRPAINPEHPGLVKTVYGIGFSVFGLEPTLVERLIVVRGISLLAGLGLVVLVSRIHPVAGIAVALHTLHAKYSCQGYLDSIPAFLMAWAMLMGWKRKDTTDPWSVVGCGVLWGAATAAKWIHGLPGIILLICMKQWRPRTCLLMVAIGFAWLLDPTAWLHPLERIHTMVEHHQRYATTVADTSTWSPWFSLAAGGPAVWHPEVFRWSLDALWLAVGLVGLGMGIGSSWGRMLAAWFFFPMFVFMVWDTRWPQHLMVVIAPLSLAVSEAVRPILSRASHHFVPSD